MTSGQIIIIAVIFLVALSIGWVIGIKVLSKKIKKIKASMPPEETEKKEEKTDE